MESKAVSYRVRSDGTAEASAGGIPEDDDVRQDGRNRGRLHGSILPMGARDVGVHAYRRVKKMIRTDRISKRASKRGLFQDERMVVSEMPLRVQNEHTHLIDVGTGSVTKSIELGGGGPVGVGGGGRGGEPDQAKVEESERYPSSKPPGVLASLWDLVFGKTISILLIFIPIAWASYHYSWGPAWVFWLNFLAMMPLASILGDFTEELAAHTNQVVGGLVNATFGNAVEVVVAIQALLANEIRVVQASMIGSIFSNLLLVLGGCFFFGGLKYKEQSFNSTAATANMSLLALSSLALVLPTPFANYYEVQDEEVLAISRIAACFLIFMYLQLLVFQLRTHASLFEDDDEEEGEMPFWVAIGGLVLVTLLIAMLSDYLVGSIDGFCENSGVSRTFVGLIILPIVGNAVEHITAVNVAMKDKMDLAMGVAVGSCTQISLFVIPVTVIVGWICDKDMTLNFPHFEITLFVLCVFIVSICISNPKSNWLEGSLLMTSYLMIAVGFWFERVLSYNTRDAPTGEVPGNGVEL